MTSWFVIGVGGTILIAGVICGMLSHEAFTVSKQNFSFWRDNTDWEAREVSDPYRQGQDLALSANILYGVGGAVAISGLTMLLFSY